MQVGVTLMTSFNILAEAIVLFAETSAISKLDGTGSVRAFYIIIGIVSFILAALQVLLLFLTNQFFTF